MIEQLTVFIQNEGPPVWPSPHAADADINMHDLFIAGHERLRRRARVFCDTPQAAAKVLRFSGLPRERYWRACRAQFLTSRAVWPTCLRDHRTGWAPISNTAIAFRVESHGHDVLKVVDDTVEGKLSEAGFDVVSAEGGLCLIRPLAHQRNRFEALAPAGASVVFARRPHSCGVRARWHVCAFRARGRCRGARER